MPIYSPVQLAQLAYNAGCRGNSVTIATAIALAESGGNSEAVDHDANGSTDYGLWQINSVHGVTQEQMFDVVQNATAMFSISSNGTNWQPWSTFTSGAYATHLGVAQAAASTVKSSKPVANPGANARTTSVISHIPVIGSAYGAAKGVGKFVGDVLNPAVWERVGYGIAGGLLILFGLYYLTKGTQVGHAIDEGSHVAEFAAA